MLRMDSASFSVDNGILGLPKEKRERVLIPLRYGNYQRSFLTDESLKRGSLTMTDSAIVTAFSTETPQIVPAKRVGYDLNHKSIVGSDGARFDLSEVKAPHGIRCEAVRVRSHASERQTAQEEVRRI